MSGREPDVGTEVSGVVPETGDTVQGMYLGSYSWAYGRPYRALLLVDGHRVVVDSATVEEIGG